MVFVYILIAIVLVVSFLWVSKERKKQEEPVSDKVEPDLNGLFQEQSMSLDTQQGHEEIDLKGIDHDDLAYRPKSQNDFQAAPEKNSFTEQEPVIAPESAVEPAIDSTHQSLKEGGFFQKIGGLFRRKEEDLQLFGDDGNLMRPAAVETVALILSAAPDQPYTFKEVLTVAHHLDLRVENGGFIQLLTTTHYGDEPMYSIGHLLGDGTFDDNLVRHHLDDTTPGLIFFSKIPGPDPDISTIEQLLSGIHHFHSALGGTILNVDQKPMSNDDLIALFHSVNKLDNEEWERAYEAYEQRNR